MSFVEQADYEHGFKKYYDESVVPVLGEIRKDHDEAYKKLNSRIITGSALGVFILGGSIYTALTYHFINPPIVLISLALIVYWATAPIRDFKKTVKVRVMNVICAFYGGLKFNSEGQKDLSLLRCPIFPSYTKAKSEDLIEGKYKENNLSLFELKLKRKSGKHTVTVFRGLVIKVDFIKNFVGRTYVKKDQGSIFNWFEKPSGTEKIHLEDPDFEAKFEVYGTDQIEARFILTTAIMERLLKLSESRKGSIQCAFNDKTLLIALSNKENLFEPRISDDCIFDENDIHIFLGQMNEIFKIIDLINKR